MPKFTVDELYEAFMDIGAYGGEGAQEFGYDVFDFFSDKLGDKGWGREDWVTKYGMYLPSFDPAQIHLAERTRDLDYGKALDTLNITQEATDRVYQTELDTLSTGLGRELEKGKVIAGKTGLRTGGLETAIQDTINIAGSKAEDLGDRLMISDTESKNKYNTAMVEGALDFDKTERAEKEEFYDRTMAAIMRLMDVGAFTDEGAGACDPDSDFPFFCPGYGCVQGEVACNLKGGGDDPFDIQLELDFEGLDWCGGQCVLPETCVMGMCMDASTFDVPDCGPGSAYVPDQGCVPSGVDPGTPITPETCPAGTFWTDNAGGCLYFTDSGFGCSGPCALYLQVGMEMGEGAYDFWSTEWAILTQTETTLDIVADITGGGDLDDKESWSEWLYCLLPTSNC